MHVSLGLTSSKQNSKAGTASSSYACELHMHRTECKQTPEVDEDALRSLWPQVADLVAAGADGCFEHEVEREGLGQLVASLGRLDAIGGQHVAQAGCFQLFHRRKHMLDFLPHAHVIWWCTLVWACALLPQQCRRAVSAWTGVQGTGAATPKGGVRSGEAEDAAHGFALQRLWHMPCHGINCTVSLHSF